jgi:hypothetical protein
MPQREPPASLLSLFIAVVSTLLLSGLARIFLKANLESVTAAAAEVARNMPADFRIRSPMRPEEKPIRSRASRGFLSGKNSMTKMS